MASQKGFESNLGENMNLRSPNKFLGAKNIINPKPLADNPGLIYRNLLEPRVSTPPKSFYSNFDEVGPRKPESNKSPLSSREAMASSVYKSKYL